MHPSNAKDGTPSDSIEFQKFYEEVLRPEIPAILTRRRRRNLWAALAAGLVFILFLWVFHHFPALFDPPGSPPREYNWFAMLLFAVALAFFTFLGARLLLLRSATALFHEKIIRPIAGFLDPGVRYAANHIVTKETFERSILFESIAESFGGYAGDSLFSGGVKGRGFEFSVLTVERAVKYGCRIRRAPLFGGMFLVRDFGRNIPGFVMAEPMITDLNEDGLAARLRECGLERPKKVKGTGNHEFDRLFVAFAADRDVAPRVLTADVTRCLVKVREQFGVEVFFSLVGETIYLALMMGRRPLAMPGPGEDFDYGKCREYLGDIAMCRDLATHPCWDGIEA